MNECRTCELVARRNQGAAPPWDAVLRTAHWDVVHAFGTDVEGWMVLVTRRHIASVAEMTDDEAAEFGPLLLRVSTALGEAVGCERTYVAQFAEAEGHHHVHVHVVPRMPDQPDEAKGPRVFSRLGLPDDRCVPEARMNELATRLRGLLRD